MNHDIMIRVHEQGSVQSNEYINLSYKVYLEDNILKLYLDFSDMYTDITVQLLKGTNCDLLAAGCVHIQSH
jgi:hypothetical protein